MDRNKIFEEVDIEVEIEITIIEEVQIITINNHIKDNVCFIHLSLFSNISSIGGGGGHYDNSYGRGRRPYPDHNRGRGGFRGNRGGNFRTHNYNGNGYQNAAQYQNVHSAPPSQQQ